MNRFLDQSRHLVRAMSLITILVVIQACAPSPSGVAASPSRDPATPPELTVADATRLIQSMGYDQIAVGAVVNGIGGLGMGAFSSPNVALVMAYGERNGSPLKINETLFYTKDHGWVSIEISTKRRAVRLWTVNGYQEVAPPAPTPPAQGQ